jgi:Mg-chelatase subunit ChlI
VDVLLDSAAMGMNIVEREGISFSHPARFILVGTMNPEEGDLRPQLLDRFALSVEIYGIRTARERMQIMQNNLDFEASPEQFRSEWMAKEHELSRQIEKGRTLVDKVTHTSRDLLSIASLTASLNVEGHRSDLVILKAARAQAAFEGRTAITDRDIALAAELALPHRLKRGPFQQAEDQHGRVAGPHRAVAGTQPGDRATSRKRYGRRTRRAKKNLIDGESEETEQTGQVEPSPQQQIFDDRNSYWWQGGEKVKTGEVFDPRRLDTPLDKIVRRSPGRRSRTAPNANAAAMFSRGPRPANPLTWLLMPPYAPQRPSRSNAPKTASALLFHSPG